MILSNTLFNTLTNKLELRTVLLQKEKNYTKNLLDQVVSLRKLKENNLGKFSKKKIITNKNGRANLQDFVIAYIVSVSFLRANTMIHVSDTKGNLKLFYSAGSVELSGKQKRKRRVAISKLISLVLKKAKFLNRKPIALHLSNVNFYKNLIVRRLKRNLYVKVIRILNQTPYNGCRKRKLRRKKYTKRFK